MYNANTPPRSELPSSRALLRSTAIALATAAVLLVTVVMPAEYGVDPTGVGSLLGLTEMGEIKVALAEEADAAAAAEAAAVAGGVTAAPGAATPAPIASPQPVADSSRNSHVTELTLQPGEGQEIKLVMREGASASYSWSVNGGVVNYDTHGDPPGAPRGFYHGYGKGTATAGEEGELIAAFDGMHGWFWRNRGSDVVTLTLRTEGDYQELKQIY
ncbi:MAG: transmembrane anchor protein [Gemmatimonadota bacterium]|nr:transmembrane anchor protein [Gemmatimonadota bacterium]